ncbi:phage tail protein [Citrobacter freundii]|uniref:phage tail protein n=1 Tax=Citrobacter freundii TaxID=546 RepID=UPI00292C2060|nr:phage tail protein [Citrobacter freundii]MDV1215062.1 phage tail protein [Citrobacter freundii]MDV1775302.1 phage tail protein [Citrobacter freundii]MEB0391891.1 phage tail protein [Citrobacter freundii]MEB0453495.1 phage tail protein [Citrobacter freundii]
MVTKYYAVLTNVGAAKLANATALGAQVEITQMAVGDGNGVLPTPNPAQTALVHELRRKPLNSLSIDPNNANQIIAEQVIPEDEGGWWIREIGLFDKDGDMIAVANCAETYKPQLQEGSGRVQVVRMILIVSSTAAVTLKIDPSVVLATRQYVDDQIIQVKSYVDQKMAAHVAAADPHKQYAPKESPALTGTPTAPTAAQTVNSTQIATTAFVKAAITALNTTINTALGLKAPLASPALTGTPTAPTAAAATNNTQVATTAFVQNGLKTKQDADSTLSDLSGKTVAGLLTYLGLRTAAKADVVGTVSQSGGVPTGAIIERGSNSNGEYTKFADGTLICWFTRSVESITSNPSGGTTNLYFSTESVFTFPATFVGTKPAVAPSAPLSSGGTSSWPSVRGSSLTGTSLALISNVQNAAAYLGYTAVGRWF